MPKKIYYTSTNIPWVECKLNYTEYSSETKPDSSCIRRKSVKSTLIKKIMNKLLTKSNKAL